MGLTRTATVPRSIRSSGRRRGRNGHRTIGVILSGSLEDGTAGLYSVKQHGGGALVQDPEDALFDGMPANAIENVAVDFIGDVAALTNELVRRTRVVAADRAVELHVTDESNELDAVEIDRDTADPDEWSAAPRQFTCPECHG